MSLDPDGVGLPHPAGASAAGGPPPGFDNYPHADLLNNIGGGGGGGGTGSTGTSYANERPSLSHSPRRRQRRDIEVDLELLQVLGGGDGGSPLCGQSSYHITGVTSSPLSLSLSFH